MTPHFHLRSPIARPEVNVVSATFAQGRCLGRSAKQVSREGWSKFTLLVILHYLLKNNTTFMGGIGQVKSSGGSTSVYMSSRMGPLLSIGGSIR